MPVWGEAAADPHIFLACREEFHCVKSFIGTNKFIGVHRANGPAICLAQAEGLGI